MIRTIQFTLFAFVSLIFITSCQKEISAENGLLPGNGNNNNNNNNNTDCKACNYYPFCDSSTYTYIDSTATGASTISQTLDMIGDTTVDGKVFQKVSAGPTSPVSFHNCTAGVTTVFGMPQPGNRVTTTILKADEPVGATWTDVNMNGGQSFDYTFTIVSKTLNKTVLSVPYSNVIQVHLTVSATLLGVTLVLAESDYFYAPNIGLIDNITYDLTSGTPVVALHRVLQSYYIP